MNDWFLNTVMKKATPRATNKKATTKAKEISDLVDDSRSPNLVVCAD